MPGFIDRIRNRLRPQPSKPQQTAPIQPTRPLPQPSPPAGTPSRVEMPARPDSQPLNLPASAQPSVPSIDLSLVSPRQPAGQQGERVSPQLTVPSAQPVKQSLPQQFNQWLGSEQAFNIAKGSSGALALGATAGLGLLAAEGAAISTVAALKDASATASAIRYVQTGSFAAANAASRMAKLFGSKWVGAAAKTASGLTGVSILSTVWKSKITKTAVGVGSGVASTDVLVSWYAMDNIISGSKFHAKDIASSLEAGHLSKAKAIEDLSMLLKTQEKAISFIQTSAHLNPLLMPFADVILSGVESERANLQLIADRINSFDPSEVQSSSDEARTFMGVVAEEKAIARALSLKQREEDRAYFDEIKRLRRIEDETDMEKVKEFWLNYAAEKRAMELRWREEDAAYYKLVDEERRKKREEQMPSKLGFGLL